MKTNTACEFVSDWIRCFDLEVMSTFGSFEQRVREFGQDWLYESYGPAYRKFTKMCLQARIHLVKQEWRKYRDELNIR